MTSPTIKFIKSPSVSVTNGSKTVTLTGSVDAYHVYDGTAIFIGSHQPVEGFSGTTVDGSGSSTITLKNTWTLPTVTAEPLVAFNSNEGLPEAIRRARSIGDLTLALMTNFEVVLNSTASSVSIDIDGVPTSFVPYQYLANQFAASQANMDSQINTLVGSISAMTKAEFLALAEQRKSQSAGSGLSEWGEPNSAWNSGEVNSGIKANIHTSTVNWLNLGVEPVIQVNGIAIKISNIRTTDNSNVLVLPPAPDGSETYDSSTGTVTQHASADIAFAAETATNKVITSRKDFVFIECWHEKISDKDVVYPLGNVQYFVTNLDNIITLGTDHAAQGYYAFGEWDSVSKGYGSRWSTLSDSNKACYIQNPENNIYSDDGELIQVRYRIRVVEGVTDSFLSMKAPFNQHSNAFSDSRSYHVKAQGSSVVPVSWIGSANAAQTFRKVEGDNGVVSTFLVGGQTANISAIPIALVQRRNQGAYHPAFNPNGSALLQHKTLFDSNPTYAYKWDATDAYKPSSMAETFARTTTASTGVVGSISGRKDDKSYDAIYASDVKDLRMSSKKLPLAEIREKYKRMAIAGEVRGFESVPFTRAFITYSTGGANQAQRTLIRFPTGTIQAQYGTIAAGVKGYYLSSHTDTYVLDEIATDGTSDYVYILGNHASEFLANTYYCAHTTTTTHKQANPTWTDIIGDPVNIAATFPDGVEGQWIPELSTLQALPLNRKYTGTTKAAVWTNNNGSSWNAVTPVINSVTNQEETTWNTNSIALIHYETQAHFTQDDVNSEVLDLGGVYGANRGYIDASGVSHNGARLTNSLLGKVAVGNLAPYDVIKPISDTHIRAVDNLLNTSIPSSHASIVLSNEDVPAVKALDYLSHDNNVAKLCYAYKEMVFDASNDSSSDFIQIADSSATYSYQAGMYYKFNGGAFSGMSFFCVVAINAGLDNWVSQDSEGNLRHKDNSNVYFTKWDGNGWGDNNQFEIASNQNKLTDDNGNAVLYGTASFDTQYFVVEE